MTEKNQIGHNETRIKNATAILRRHEHRIGYSCKVCGNPIDANSPDDVYKSSSVYQCWKFDWIERNHQCHECNNTTTLYWHPEGHKFHDCASLEEIKRKISKDNRRKIQQQIICKGWQDTRLINLP